MYMNCIEQLRSKITAYVRKTQAAIAILFALMAPLVIGAGGMAIDYAMAYLVQQRLMQALDSSALAAAATSSEESVIRQKVKQFFQVNFPNNRIGDTFDPVITVVDNEVHVQGSAQYQTMFLGIIGVHTIDVAAETTVQREVQGLEVVLVLDNTGSMSSNNNIGTLRQASKNFVNILYDSARNPSSIKVGMVPYSSSVRIGRYGLGKNPDGTQYADGDVFVNLPEDMSYTTDYTSYDWFGCVVEHNPNGYETGASYVSGSKGQLWRDSANNLDGHGWDPSKGNNDPYDYDVLDDYEGPWDVYSYGRIIRGGGDSTSQRCSDMGSSYSNSSSRCSNCTSTKNVWTYYGWQERSGYCADEYCFCSLRSGSGGTNRNCPNAYIQPLVSDRAKLLDHVDTMTANGFTYGNIGMAWGARLLSPAAPFEEGADWTDKYWRKAIIMMTDGNNTMENTYSAYWATNKHNVSVSDLNDRFEETCTALKEKGVTIYTVTFSSGINDTTKDYYKRCASAQEQYFDAPTQEELIQVFERISRELSQLYIKS
tara:strand:- start:2255 stop:3871 length:1617 start_codon:yes stop_codon:yes gene_type:complete